MNNKIIIKNIYYMLTYAFQVLHQSNYKEIETESFENIHDMFAAVLAKGIAQQLKQGLYKEYVEIKDDLQIVHGKIDFNGTIKHVLKQNKRVSCEYDELSENNVFNQIIKTIALLLSKEQRVKSDTRFVLRKEMTFFSGVDQIDPYRIKWNMLRFDRNNQTYRLLISICRFIAEGLLLTTEDGKIKMAQFLDEQRMSRLYEKFILEFYRKEIPQIKTSASMISWQVDDGISTLLPAMKSDIMLKYKNKTLIIDAKYYSHSIQYQYDKATIHSQNIYQIFTYVKNEDIGNTGNVSGMLLYAKTDENITPDMDVVISGNTISAKTLDMNCDFEQIAKQLICIAQDYFELKEI